LGLLDVALGAWRAAHAARTSYLPARLGGIGAVIFVRSLGTRYNLITSTWQWTAIDIGYDGGWKTHSGGAGANATNQHSLDYAGGFLGRKKSVFRRPRCTSNRGLGRKTMPHLSECRLHRATSLFFRHYIPMAAFPHSGLSAQRTT
jgi:hypothetical protein